MSLCHATPPLPFGDNDFKSPICDACCSTFHSSRAPTSSSTEDGCFRRAHGNPNAVSKATTVVGWLTCRCNRNKASGAPTQPQAAARQGRREQHQFCACVKGANGRRCKNKAPRGIYCFCHACPVDDCEQPKSSQAPRCGARARHGALACVRHLPTSSTRTRERRCVAETVQLELNASVLAHKRVHLHTCCRCTGGRVLNNAVDVAKAWHFSVLTLCTCPCFSNRSRVN